MMRRHSHVLPGFHGGGGSKWGSSGGAAPLLGRSVPMPLVLAIALSCLLMGFYSGSTQAAHRAAAAAASVAAATQQAVAAEQQAATAAAPRKLHASTSGGANPQARALQQPVQQPEPVQQQPAPVQQQPAPVQQQPAPVEQQPAPVEQPHAPHVLGLAPPGQLPDPDAFAAAFVEASGLAALRPPLTPAASGSPNYTVAPYQILSWYPRIQLYPNFIDARRAAHIIKLAAGRMAPSGLAYRPGEAEDPHQQTRTSSGVFVNRHDDPDGVLAWLEDRIAAVTMLPLSHHESFNVLHYRKHQRYESHMDTFDPKEFGPQPSQRMATMLVYLSDVEEGGETVFKREGEDGAERPVTDWSSCEPHEFKYKPRLGDAVLFYSLDPDLTINPRSLHGGCSVERGEKWVATRWMHNLAVEFGQR